MRLAVDLGTTWTAAAIDRGDGRVEVVPLGQGSHAVPSCVFVEDGGTVVGDPAVLRGAADPSRLAREFKRRFGDTTPIVLGGRAWTADGLTTSLLRWVLDRVEAEEGRRVDEVVLTHPATWGPYKLELLRAVGADAGAPAVGLVAEPVAAAAWYASSRALADGSHLAVYDLGGGTFDVACVRVAAGRFAVEGVAQGIDRFGGVDVDAALLHLVLEGAGVDADRLDADDPAVAADVHDLRARCVQVKEALSAAATADVPVRVGAVRTTVRVTRAELEQRVRPALQETVACTRRALTAAGLDVADLAGLLLVGGASRMPLVAQLVGEALACPVVVDANPKLAIAQGALRAVDPQAAPVVPPPPPPPPPAPDAVVPLDTAPPRSRRVAVAAAGLAAAAAVLVAAVVLARGDDEGGGGLAGATTTTTTATGVLPAADGCAGRPIVSVVNGTAIAGLATAARDRLAELGWDATSGNGAQVTATQLLVDEGYEDIAREVAGVLGLDTTPEPMPDQVPVGADFFADVVVIVGPGFTPPGPARRVLGIDGFEYTSNFCDRTSGGGLVAVENDDDVAHTVTSTSGSWPAVEVEAGADGAFEVPAEAGSYEYFCTIHGAAVMAGTLVVTAGS